MQNGYHINWPRLVLAALDVSLVNGGLLAAFWLRYDGEVQAETLAMYYPEAFYGSLIAVAIFYAFGLYSRIWLHASIEALGAVLGAVTCSTVALAAFVWIASPSRLPHSVTVTAWLIWMALIGGSRLMWRLVRETIPLSHRNGRDGSRATRVLIYGAGAAGAMLARQLEQDNGNGFELVGLVDDDPFKRRMLVRRTRVLGSGAELQEIVRRHQVDEVIVAIPSASGVELRQVVQRCVDAAIPHRVLPSVLELGGSAVRVDDAREVDLADLLGRAPAEFPVETYGDYLRGKVVLVTGAGGSIGSEICRQVARFSPKQLLLVGRGENRIHDILREMRGSYPDVDVVPIIANVAVWDAARELLERYSPQIIIHAAAHKHVYLMEQHPIEAVRNNIIGTDYLSELAITHAVERFIMISTDKAVDPTSVMGASKRFCELLCQARQRSARNTGTIFTTVRFGNVLGSAGSVLTIFRQQLRAKRPLTITHPDATRYFMTIPEAALLVLQSGGINQGGDVFVLDMGEPVRIRDLAAELVRLHGGDPDDPRNYRYIGTAPGEKLHEQLWGADERVTRVTDHILQVTCAKAAGEAEIESLVRGLHQLLPEGDVQRMREALFAACEHAAIGRVSASSDAGA